LNELINSLIHKTFPESDKRISFHPSENLPYFKLDAGLIEQIIHNLVLNALQYTPQQSAVKIDAVHRNNTLTITISDQGDGFPEHAIPMVFDKFYRLPNTRASGSGLGLSIVKGFVEAHNGKVRLENNREGGARFTIEIPAETTYINSLKNE
jgi:two-component system sensor histidine kinase KdpD